MEECLNHHKALQNINSFLYSDGHVKPDFDPFRWGSVGKPHRRVCRATCRRGNHRAQTRRWAFSLAPRPRTTSRVSAARPTPAKNFPTFENFIINNRLEQKMSLFVVFGRIWWVDKGEDQEDARLRGCTCPFGTRPNPLFME